MAAPHSLFVNRLELVIFMFLMSIEEPLLHLHKLIYIIATTVHVYGRITRLSNAFNAPHKL